MKDAYELTIETYDKSSKGLSDSFRGIGSRTDYIEHALKLAGKSSGAHVLEIGCGDGRDAKEIIKRVEGYLGFDPSIGLLDIAKKDLPEAEFVVSDVQSFDFPDNLDVVFAFASLLHIPKDELPSVFGKIHKSLKQSGVLFLTLKERDEYAEVLQKDEFGERMFYYYNPKIIEGLAGAGYKTAYVEQLVIGKTKWFTMAMKKL